MDFTRKIPLFSWEPNGRSLAWFRIRLAMSPLTSYSAFSFSLFLFVIFSHVLRISISLLTKVTIGKLY